MKGNFVYICLCVTFEYIHKYLTLSLRNVKGHRIRWDDTIKMNLKKMDWFLSSG